MEPSSREPWAGDRLGPPLFGILFIRNDGRVKLDRFFKVIFHTLLGRENGAAAPDVNHTFRWYVCLCVSCMSVWCVCM